MWHNWDLIFNSNDIELEETMLWNCDLQKYRAETVGYGKNVEADIHYVIHYKQLIFRIARLINSLIA